MPIGSDKQLSLQLNHLLACPRCHAAVRSGSDEYICQSCGFRRALREGVVYALQDTGETFFDAHFKTMQSGNQDHGVIQLCYQRQARMVEESIKPGQIVVDVGCGPALAYKRPSACTIVGLDPSLQSLCSNGDLDLKIFGSAEQIPLRSATVDLVVCFYSVHHMVGTKKAQNRSKVAAAFREFSRIIKPGGAVMVFDMSPWWPVWLAECALWDAARMALDKKLDMFFWHKSALSRLAAEIFPNARLNVVSFATPLSTTFPPIFALPNFRLPRAVYPLDAVGYRWDF